VDLALEALAVKIGAQQVQGCREPEAQARDGGEGDLMMQGGRHLEDTAAFCNPEDGGETVGGWCAPERQRGPVACEDVLREEADAAGAEAQRGWGEAIAIFAVQDVSLALLCRDAVGSFVVELSQEAAFPARGCLRPCALATEVESRDHGWTQRGHELSPFVRRVVGLRRKTA
jgi:hypothetical protein